MTVEQTTHEQTTQSRPPSRMTALGWLAIAGAALVAKSDDALPSGFRDSDVDKGQRQSRKGGSERKFVSPLSATAAAPKVHWFQLAKSLFLRFSNDRIMAVAAGTTFYALLAVFPALGALISLYGLIADPAAIQSQISALSTVIPGGLAEIAGEQARRIASTNSSALSFGFVSGLVLSIWSANAGVKALFDALNIVYEVREVRSFIRLNATSLAFTAGMIVFIIIALLGTVGIPAIASVVHLGGPAAWLVELARWPALLVVVAVLLAVLYRFGPCLIDAKWRWISPGSAAASIVWLAASAGFAWYAAHFGSYNQTYGTLGAAIALMTWMWISLNIVLAGGEINMEIDRQAGIAPKQKATQ